MAIEWVDQIVRLVGGVLAVITLGVIFYGIWRGLQRQVGRTTGQAGAWLHSAWFYLITTAVFIGLCAIGWKPLPLAVSQSARWGMMALGALLYFPALGLALWARSALGENYFPSSGLGVQLFADHQLVTQGPFAILRHPMYVGLILAAFGSLLIYLTWTTLFLACFAPLLVIRARREEAALAMEFGAQWQEYRQRVPGWFPSLGSIVRGRNQ